MRTISSRQNPLVRAFRGLSDSPDPGGRRVVLDGVHLVRDAMRAGLAIETIAVGATRLERDGQEREVARPLEAAGVDVVAVTEPVLAAMSPVRSPSGIIAIARRPVTTVARLVEQPQPLLLVAVDVQDPGNVGALIRAAEAAGADGAVVCGLSAHPFSAKALRGSMGSALRLPVVAELSVAAINDCLERSDVRTVAAVARGGEDPDAIDWTGRVALLLGGEGPGLTEDVIARCDRRVTIPMAPAVESLNVAAAGAILMYAARRQRV
jgi:RNA methyltransferase, TrmH family